jgi:hypothetical protein
MLRWLVVLAVACGGPGTKALQNQVVAGDAGVQPYACFTFPGGETDCRAFAACEHRRAELGRYMMGKQPLGPCVGVDHVTCFHGGDPAPDDPAPEQCFRATDECERAHAAAGELASDRCHEK